jgi:hypothetical protein
VDTELEPNKFFVFRNGPCEASFATFTHPGWVEDDPIEDENSYTIMMDREAGKIVSMKIDDLRFRFTQAQAMALAEKLMEVSGYYRN